MTINVGFTEDAKHTFRELSDDHETEEPPENYHLLKKRLEKKDEQYTIPELRGQSRQVVMRYLAEHSPGAKQVTITDKESPFEKDDYVALSYTLANLLHSFRSAKNDAEYYESQTEQLRDKVADTRFEALKKLVLGP